MSSPQQVGPAAPLNMEITQKKRDSKQKQTTLQSENRPTDQSTVHAQVITTVKHWQQHYK